MLSDREKAGLPAGKKISLPINRDNVILIGIFGTDLGPEVKDSRRTVLVSVPAQLPHTAS